MLVTKNVSKITCAAAIVIFALWFRLYFQATTHWDHPIRADAGQYYSIGWNLVHHGVFSMAKPSDVTPLPDSYRGPGYPLLVALSMQLGGDDGWIRYLLLSQALLGALSVALIILIARQWLPFSYAMTAGVLAAIWPHTVTLSGLILTETFFGFSLLLGTYTLGWALKSDRAYRYVLAGLVFGYSALINPMIMLFPVFIFTILIFYHRKFALLFLVCALVLPGSWALRGSMLDSDRTSSGRLMENVLAGMEPDFDYLDTPLAMAAKSRVRKGVDDFQNNRPGALRMIWERIGDDPTHYIKWYFIDKPRRFWQWSILGPGDIYVYPVVVSPFHEKPFYRGIASFCSSLNPWLMGAAIGYLLVSATKMYRHPFRKQDMHLTLVIALFVYATLLHSALTPDPRYATPFRSFEILLAVSLLAWVSNYMRDSRQKPPEGNV